MASRYYAGTTCPSLVTRKPNRRYVNKQRPEATGKRGECMALVSGGAYCTVHRPGGLADKRTFFADDHDLYYWKRAQLAALMLKYADVSYEMNRDRRRDSAVRFVIENGMSL